DALDGVAELLGDELGGVGVDHVVDLRHVALLHQKLDHVHGALGHAVGELLDGDGLRDGDLARELLLRLVAGVPLEALHAAAERGDGTFALLVSAERGNDGEAATVLLCSAARRLRRRRRAGGATGTATRPRRFVLVGFERRPSGRPSTGWLRGLLAATLLRFLLGLLLGLELGAAALVLVGLAGFRGLALGTLGGLARFADGGFLLRDFALFRFAQACIVERVDPCLLLLLGEAAQ